MPDKRTVVRIMEGANLCGIGARETYLRRASTVTSWGNWILGTSRLPDLAVGDVVYIRFDNVERVLVLTGVDTEAWARFRESSPAKRPSACPFRSPMPQQVKTAV